MAQFGVPPVASFPNEHNFVFPVKTLSNDLVELSPFDPAKHSALQALAVKDDPLLYRYLGFGPISSEEQFNEYFNRVFQPDPTFCLFAIKDKTKVDPAHPDPHPTPGDLTPETFAGVLAFMTCSVANSMGEIGCITIYRPFQRTHVLTNACGLLLHYALDPPSVGGLGLRRMQWQANTENLPSVNAAKRMGFRFEGVLRWWRVLPQNKKGLVPEDMERESDAEWRGPGRHEAMLSICWDDWEGGVREEMDKKMILRKKDA
ncbi:acyl-CoA N-acyltransferase [Clavulina sp. PMI_390]|nr:acyl-CoA N-acyltransferase [Clavulina sp. PMI_390]